MSEQQQEQPTQQEILFGNEVDFYNNPTILSRLILNQKYDTAIKRLKIHPSEASTWVTSKRNPFNGSCMNLLQNKLMPGSSSRSVVSTGSIRSEMSHRRITKALIRKGKVALEYSMRQLPIHVACSNLLRASNNETLRAGLETLITRLVIVYPEGCALPDHEGKIPLHEAIWHNAVPSTISMLLMASPNTIHERDKYGRTPLDLNRLRIGENKEQVKEMLLRGSMFWDHARREAVERVALLHSKKETTMTTDSHQHPLCDAVSPVKITTTPVQAETGMCHVVQPVTWIKLEQRAIRLEQLLAEVYEKNYENNELIEAQQREKAELEEEIERLESLNNEGKSVNVHHLLEENDDLREEIQVLKQELQSKVWQHSSTTPPLDDDILHFLEDRNTHLQMQVDQLTISNQEYQRKLERHTIVMESLRKKEEQENASNYDDDDRSRDFETLLETLQTDSHYASERFLAKKILDLEEKLVLLEDAASSNVSRTIGENSRLSRENKFLYDKVLSFSSRNIGSIVESPITVKQSRTLHGKRNGATSTNWLEKGSKPVETDDLDSVLHQVAAMNQSDRSFDPPSLNVESVHTKSDSSSIERDRSNQSVRVHDARALPHALGQTSVKRDHESLHSIPSPTMSSRASNISSSASRSPSVQQASQSSNVSPHIKIDTKAKPLAEQTTSSGCDIVHLQELLVTAAHLYGKPIPIELARSLRIAFFSSGRISELGESTILNPSTDVEDRVQLLKSLPELPVIEPDVDQTQNLESVVGTTQKNRGNSPIRELFPIRKKFVVVSNSERSQGSTNESFDNKLPSMTHEAEKIHSQSLHDVAMNLSTKGSVSGSSSRETKPDGSYSSPGGISKTLLNRTIPQTSPTANVYADIDEPRNTVVAPEIFVSHGSPSRSTRSSSMSSGPYPHSVSAEFKRSFMAFVKDVEDAYDKPIPSNLVFALQKASFQAQSFDEDLEPPDFAKVLEETERLYSQPIPDDLRIVLTSVAIGEDDDEVDAIIPAGFHVNESLEETKQRYEQKLSSNMDMWNALKLSESIPPNVEESTNINVRDVVPEILVPHKITATPRTFGQSNQPQSLVSEVTFDLGGGDRCILSQNAMTQDGNIEGLSTQDHLVDDKDARHTVFADVARTYSQSSSKLSQIAEQSIDTSTFLQSTACSSESLGDDLSVLFSQAAKMFSQPIPRGEANLLDTGVQYSTGKFVRTPRVNKFDHTPSGKNENIKDTFNMGIRKVLVAKQVAKSSAEALAKESDNLEDIFRQAARDGHLRSLGTIPAESLANDNLDDLLKQAAMSHSF